MTDLSPTAPAAQSEEEQTYLGSLTTTDDQQDKVKALLWTYRDIFVDDLKDMPPIDLIYYRVRLKEETPIYSVRQRRYAG